MSNVLIGIIGVILFIGLALAGALFLGPRFQESTQNAKASATIQAVSQIASAVTMANTQSGETTLANINLNDLVTGGYLKAIPNNPVTGDFNGDLYDQYPYSNEPNPAHMAVMKLYAANGGEAVCRAIARQSGQPEADVTTGLNALPNRPSGCFRASDNIVAAIQTGDFIAFARI